MGGCTFVITGETPEEVRRKFEEKLKEAREAGLCKDKVSCIRKDPKDENYFQVLRVHS